MRVIIFNAVLTNNGDAALVFSLYEALKKSRHEVKIASQHFDVVRSIYPEYPVIREIADYKIIKRIPYNKFVKMIIAPIHFVLSRHFLRAQVVVASPGGYINSYYGFSKVAVILITAKLLGKKTAIYSQSIGPLNKKDRLLIKITSRFTDVIYVRDKFSYGQLQLCLKGGNNYFQTEDGAFLIPFDPVDTKSNLIAISVRIWAHDDRNKENYYSIIRLIVDILIQRGYKIEFVSTCQGLEGYVNDTMAAREIVETFDQQTQEKIYINSNYYKLNEFQKYIEKFNAVVGTRLHMCILSMLKGKPSFNISYEIKGREAYSYLGLSDYTIDYNEHLEKVQEQFHYFLNTLEQYRGNLQYIITQANQKATEFLDDFLKKII